MQSDYAANSRVHLLFSAVEFEIKYQDVSTVAIRIQNVITQEHQLMYGARFLFDKAVSNPSVGPKCAELAKAIANVAVMENGNPYQLKTFRDCIIQLAMDEMKISNVESKRLQMAHFIMHLHKAEMLSTEFINYRIAYFNSFKGIVGLKSFMEELEKKKLKKVDGAPLK